MNIIRELRKKAGIGQKELADIVGVSIPTVSDWETGKKQPSKERLRKLAEYFQVDELVILGKRVINISDENKPRTSAAGDMNIRPKVKPKTRIAKYRYSRR